VEENSYEDPRAKYCSGKHIYNFYMFSQLPAAVLMDQISSPF